MTGRQPRFRLVPYIMPSGRLPVQDFIESLSKNDPDAYVRFQDLIRPLVEELGPSMGMPHFRHLPPTDFSEIRWDGIGHGHHRIYCTIENEGRILLLHAVTKRWPKFNRGDKRICRNRYNDYLSGNYDVQKRLRLRSRT